MGLKARGKQTIRKELESLLLRTRPQVIIHNESKSKNKTYIPYTTFVNDNLVRNVEDTTYQKDYTEKALNEMRALTSSSTLTYNTFCFVGNGFTLNYNGDEYTTFIPEAKRHPLNFDKTKDLGKANIDAELISNDKVLMVEMKLFEPYYFSAKSTLYKLPKYKDETSYDSTVFTETLKQSWIDLFSKYEQDIIDKVITQFDVIQFIKHLLSIVNNKETFKPNQTVELMALTWHASYSSPKLKADELIRLYDEESIRQCKDVVSYLNTFLHENGYDWVTVSSKDYYEFIMETNYLDEFVNIAYLKRYITIT